MRTKNLDIINVKMYFIKFVSDNKIFDRNYKPIFLGIAGLKKDVGIIEIFKPFIPEFFFLAIFDCLIMGKNLSKINAF